MKPFFSTFLILALPFISIAQNCFNANIETGTLDGFTAFVGRIDETGQVIMEEQGINDDRHKIMHISEGFDTVALTHCEINKFLPVVPSEGGEYTLRLGNASVGAEADLIGLKFTVSADNPFFQLRYAVVLNDPDHKEFEQPRFELRILDETNTVIPCGEYKVKAAPEIPDFESCRNGWRVRPWTTVGFDLQPYIGQTLLIEFLTTDCTQGAHAGYAYLEASCNPFKMEIEEHCPKESLTTASVTDGYRDYLWNTGETSTSINIADPQEHSAYTVTITSATGCSFVMSDTLAFSYPPEFFPEQDLSFCRDTQYWFTPKGAPLFSVHSPTLDLTADSFLIGNDRPNYTFISANPNECYSDTLTFNLSKTPMPISSSESTLDCYGDENGTLQVKSHSDFLPLNYQWSNGATDSTLSNLAAGSYSVTISDAINCRVTSTLNVYAPPQLQLDYIDMQPITCNGMNNAKLAINPVGGVEPYDFKWNAESRTTQTLDNLGAGNYAVTVIDANGCEVQDSVAIYEPSPLILDAITTNISCFANEDGSIDVAIAGGISPYSISWEDAPYANEIYRENLGAGTYRAYIKDDVGCTKDVEVVIHQPILSKACGTYIPNAFSPNGDNLNDWFYVVGSLSSITIKNIQIYNRWGELVFENNGQCTEIGNENCGWDGRFRNQPAPVGVYVYLITLETPFRNKPILYTGDVTLTK